MKTKNDEYILKLIEDPNYIVDISGKVYTRIARTGKKMLNNKWREISHHQSKGYLHINYNRKKLFIHRIVYAKFIGSLSSDLVINHKNGIKTDNRPENLELVTIKENNIHRFRVLKTGAVIGNFKINKYIADEIRKDHKNGNSYRVLVNKYGLSKSSISAIINNKIWKNEI